MVRRNSSGLQRWVFAVTSSSPAMALIAAREYSLRDRGHADARGQDAADVVGAPPPERGRPFQGRDHDGGPVGGGQVVQGWQAARGSSDDT